MTERAAILRAIDGRTASGGTTQQIFLRVARDGDGTLTLTLCDGCTTWVGLLTRTPRSLRTVRIRGAGQLTVRARSRDSTYAPAAC